MKIVLQQSMSIPQSKRFLVRVGSCPRRFTTTTVTKNDPAFHSP